MNEDQPMNEAPRTPVDGTSGEGTAERYIHTELKRAKDSLLRTQIISSLAVVLLGGYTLYVTSRFREAMQPQEAAKIAQGLVAQRLDDGGVQFADYVKKEVPNYFRQAPDYAIKRLPEFRQELEERVNTSIETYAKQSSEQLGGEVDKFLENNKEAVGTLIKDGQNPEATAKINAELKNVFVKYLDEPAPDGESMKAKLDKALDVLKKVEARTKRLAMAKDLNPAEKNAKKAIAVLLKTVHDKRVEEGQTDAIAPKMVDQARGQVQSAIENSAAAR